VVSSSVLAASVAVAGTTPTLGTRVQPKPADRNGISSATSALAVGTTSLPADGQWYYTSCDFSQIGPDGQGGWMLTPAQDALWEVSSSDPVMLRITDAWLTGDRFEVYVDGNLALTTPSVADGGAPVINPDNPGSPLAFGFQERLWASNSVATYSHGEVVLPAGSHTINVKLIASPVTGAGLGILAEPHHLPLNEITPKSGPDGASVEETWSGVKNLFR
jgi:hypothetical protein